MRIIVKAATFVVLGATLAGCNLLPVRTVHDYCQLDKPVKLLNAEYDLLGKESQDLILAHNEAGKAVCGKTYK